MKKPSFDDRPTAIEREACAWIAQLDGDEPPSTEDLAALREWIERSPAHRMEIERLAKLWGELNLLTELAAPDRQHRRRSGFAAFIARCLPRPAISLALASAILVAAGALFLRPAIAPQTDTVFMAYRTEIGEQLRAPLADGSEVMLNTDSQLRVDSSSAERAVWLLRGEVYFDVAHDADRPFVVYAGDGLVRAIGTAFSVKLTGRVVEVTVNEGRVELATAAPAESDMPEPATPRSVRFEKLALLNAGQKATFRERIDQVQSIAEEEMERKLSWQKGMLVFSGDSLESVVREVSRYTPYSIEIQNPRIAELRIGGQFRVGEIDALFEALETSFGVEVHRTPDQRILLSMAEQADPE